MAIGSFVYGDQKSEKNLFKADFPGYEIIEYEDYHRILKNEEYFENPESVKSFLIVELNGDSKDDFIFYVKSKDRALLVAYLSENGDHSPHVVSETKWPDGYNDGIWEVLWIKGRGRKGLSDLKYFNAPSKDYPYLREHTQADIEEYLESVKIYVSATAIEKTSIPFDLFEADKEYLFSCFEYFHFFRYQLHFKKHL